MLKKLSIICLALTLTLATPAAFQSCSLFQSPTISEASTEQIILRAEQTAEAAKVTFTAFVHMERDNEALLKQFNPNIHVWADQIRVHGLDWIVQLRNATKTFKANRTAENRAGLNTILATLTKALAQTTDYLKQSKAIALP
jgi:hypothetical protein